MHVDRLPRAELSEASALLAGALPHDQVAVVAKEKLFGANGDRHGLTFGAWQSGRLVGVIALAARWLKLLAVAPDARGRGIGTALLDFARHQADGRLRIFDHPGNYLSPGLDVRYEDAHRFLARRGFRRLAEVDNLRCPLDDNPLVTEARSRELDAAAAAAGYPITRVDETSRAAVLDFVARAFAPSWAFEAARAADGPRRALHAAFHDGAPVAFAAADGNNQGLGWFGPAGTLPAHRGRRLGEALLLRCLLDVRGLPEGGVIAWVGPKPFYARACGATDDRRFVTWEAP